MRTSMGCRRIAFVAFILIAASSRFAPGQVTSLPHHEPFNYPNVGNALDAESTDWARYAGTGANIVRIGAGSLTAPSGLPPSTGNSVEIRTFTDNGDDLEMVFGEQRSGLIYASFLFTPTSGLTAADHFAGFRNNNNGHRLRVFVRADGLGNHVYGVSKGSTSPDAEASAAVAPGTHLIVIKYDLSTLPNPTASIFVNPDPGQPEPAADAATMNPASTDTNIRAFYIRQSAVVAGVLDEVRIGYSFADVLKNPPADVVPPDLEYVVPFVPVIGSPGKIELVFNEPVTGVAAGNLIVAGSPAAGVVLVSQTRYIFSGFVPPGPGIHTVTVNPGAIRDRAGNPFPGRLFSLNVVLPPPDGLIVYEPFSYPEGVGLTWAGDWSGEASGANVFVKADASLSFPGLPESQGGRIRVLAGSSGDANRHTTAILGEGNAMYYSFIFKPVGAPGDSYWAHAFTEGSVHNQLGRFHAGSLNDPSHTLGARWRDPVSAVLHPMSVPVGRSVFVVGKVSMVPGVDNDTFGLWINPPLGVAEPSPDVTAVSQPGLGNDIDPAFGIHGLGLRIFPNVGDYEMDELRIGITWEAVTPQGPVFSVRNWNLFK